MLVISAPGTAFRIAARRTASPVGAGAGLAKAAVVRMPWPSAAGLASAAGGAEALAGAAAGLVCAMAAATVRPSKAETTSAVERFMRFLGAMDAHPTAKRPGKFTHFATTGTGRGAAGPPIAPLARIWKQAATELPGQCRSAMLRRRQPRMFRWSPEQNHDPTSRAPAGLDACGMQPPRHYAGADSSRCRPRPFPSPRPNQLRVISTTPVATTCSAAARAGSRSTRPRASSMSGPSAPATIRASRSCCCTEVPARRMKPSRPSTAISRPRASNITSTTSWGSAFSDQPHEPFAWELPTVSSMRSTRCAPRSSSGPTISISYGQSWAASWQSSTRSSTRTSSKGLVISNMMSSIPAYNAYA